jgi:hypothetical protein
MADDMTPSDVEPNGGPCITPTKEQVERAVIVLDQYRNPNSNQAKLGRLRKQLGALEAAERELELKKQVINDIADIREKIKAFGEIPCA